MAEENTFPHFVESLLKMDSAPEAESESPVDAIADLTSVNTCLTKDSLRQLDRKLVRFDGQVCDMFEEEYFVPLVPKKQPGESANPLVYKYFSELSTEDMAEYEMGMDSSSRPIERGNILASSPIHMQGWTGPQAAASG